ncbi:MAG: hypothetical protein Q4F65_12005 [Propionibacteriaceae bacterium]|nr:hypothetical protein [Propionibacteriaceae bacterium]
MATPKRLLLEHLYDGDLAAEVARRTEAGQSWRDIANHIAEVTGQPVSYETVRTWYGATEAVAS